MYSNPVNVALIAFVGVLLGLALLRWRLRERERVTVWEWQQGLLFRDGRFVSLLPPGRHRAGPGRTVAAVSMNARMTTVSGQEALTRDGFPVRLSATVVWRVTDARRYHAANGGVDAFSPEPLVLAAQAALRRTISGTDLDGLLALRAEGAPMAEELRASVAAAAAELGAEVTAAILRDLHLPAEVRRMITEVERARREGLAALERARGEHAALRSLANAARMMRGNPELQALRTLQALTPAPGRPAPTLVLGAGAVMPVAPAGAAPAPEPDSPEG